MMFNLTSTLLGGSSVSWFLSLLMCKITTVNSESRASMKLQRRPQWRLDERVRQDRQTRRTVGGVWEESLPEGSCVGFLHESFFNLGESSEHFLPRVGGMEGMKGRCSRSLQFFIFSLLRRLRVLYVRFECFCVLKAVMTAFVSHAFCLCERMGHRGLFLTIHTTDILQHLNFL